MFLILGVATPVRFEKQYLWGHRVDIILKQSGDKKIFSGEKRNFSFQKGQQMFMNHVR